MEGLQESLFKCILFKSFVLFLNNSYYVSYSKSLINIPEIETNLLFCSQWKQLVNRISKKMKFSIVKFLRKKKYGTFSKMLALWENMDVLSEMFLKYLNFGARKVDWYPFSPGHMTGYLKVRVYLSRLSTSKELKAAICIKIA